MLLGPVLVIRLRIYLQIQVEHSSQLERLVWSVPAARAVSPSHGARTVPLKNPLIRPFKRFGFYMLAPLVTILFAWKAAVFPVWDHVCSALQRGRREPRHAAA
jgi:hypothetical protein